MGKLIDIFDNDSEHAPRAALSRLLAKSPIGGYLLFLCGLFMLFCGGLATSPRESDMFPQSFALGAFLVGFSLFIMLRITNKTKYILLIVSVAVLAVGTYIGSVHIPSQDYNFALNCMEQGDYEKAKRCFENLGDYKDSEEKAIECVDGIRYMHTYNHALSCMQKEHYAQAKMLFDSLGSFRDSEEKALECAEHLHEP